MKDSNYENYLNEISSDSKKLTIVDVYATWCGPCKMLGPVMNEIDSEGHADVIKINLDEGNNSKLLEEVKSGGVPTLLFFKGKTLKSVHTGYLPKDEIMKTLTTIK
ncbi:MAG: thioredoxin domain-containing protein [Mycoplasma sp.]|nr:thioredoxin domain-containing protein [Mycoplasma sp.]